MVFVSELWLVQCLHFELIFDLIDVAQNLFEVTLELSVIEWTS